jgi:SagB-type dehydrogenase family enzyme
MNESDCPWPRFAQIVPLPSPDTEGGIPLMQALRRRRTTREIGTADMPLGMLSNLLWAAGGINRPEDHRRTAPTARNQQEIDVYAATANGLHLYEPRSHSLRLQAAADVRAQTGVQDFVAEVPLNLIYVADLARMVEVQGHHREFYAAVDTGFISENVYLFCAAFGLATVVRGSIDRATLAETLRLRPEQRIIVAQSVGWPLT